MRGWVWWPVVGLCGFIACGGSSVRRNSGGDDDGTSGSAGVSVGSGGTSGGAGASGGKGGTSKGGSPSTGGRGGATVTGGRGGSVPRGGVGNTAGDGGSAGDPSGGAGAAGAPVCDFAGGNDCSFDQACEALGCGTAWSEYDSNLCVRSSCARTGLCEGGERCVVAPVAGNLTDVCGNESDSCGLTAAGCECYPYEECFPSAVCLPVDEFPPEDDCPIESLDCAGLERAMATLETYLDGGSDVFLEPYEAPANLAADLRVCFRAAFARYENECS